MIPQPLQQQHASADAPHCRTVSNESSSSGSTGSAERALSSPDFHPDGSTDRPPLKSSSKKKHHQKKEKLYCLCRTPYNGADFYIGCDGCRGWFHGSCVGISPDQSALVDLYYCPDCVALGRGTTTSKVKCFNDACSSMAVFPSKYCSQACGLVCARGSLAHHLDVVSSYILPTPPTHPGDNLVDYLLSTSTSHNIRLPYSPADLSDVQELQKVLLETMQLQPLLAACDRKLRFLCAVSKDRAAYCCSTGDLPPFICYYDRRLLTYTDIERPSQPDDKCMFPDYRRCDRHRNWMVEKKYELELDRVQLLSKAAKLTRNANAIRARLLHRRHDIYWPLTHQVTAHTAEDEQASDTAPHSDAASQWSVDVEAIITETHSSADDDDSNSPNYDMKNFHVD
ncbi:COMPASS (complex proteins associated with Set1p) component [Sorochytrium milnesiophthora]